MIVSAAAERPFFDAIWENPDDDLPRLVFADWLEERGDPRAELIRVQCELEKTEWDDPRRDALEDRESEILPKLVDDLLLHRPCPPRLKWGVNVWNSRCQTDYFRRGLPSAASIVPGMAKDAPLDLPSFARDTLFAECHLAASHSIAQLGDEPWLSRLRRLVVPRWEPEKFPFLQSSRLANLRHLHLEMDHVPGRMTEWACFSNLESFAFYATPSWVGRDLNRGLLRGLRALRIIYCPSQLASRIAGDPAVAQLRQVEFRVDDRYTASTTRAIPALTRSPHWEKLAWLSLEQADIVEEDLAALAAFSGLSRLRGLSLGSRPQSIGLAIPCDVLLAGRLTALRELRLHRQSVGASGARAIAASQHLRELRVLKLVDCRLDEEAAVLLAESPHLQHLRALNLSQNPIGKSGKEALLRRFGSKLVV